MCGILGYSGRFDPCALQRGLDCIAHRGPDDSGLVVDQGSGIGLGHRRLSILDLSPLGHQPMVAGEAGVTIIFNGEIYNFRELRRDLESRGHAFRGHSDTEVILALYLEHGERMLPMLNGIFALAVWDPRDRTMLIARDALGVKPLYVAELPGAWRTAARSRRCCTSRPSAVSWIRRRCAATSRSCGARARGRR